jgi:hypothetical protein
LAGWINKDANGGYLTVEISPKYVSRKPVEKEDSISLSRFFSDEEEVH